MCFVWWFTHLLHLAFDSRPLSLSFVIFAQLLKIHNHIVENYGLSDIMRCLFSVCLSKTEWNIVHLANEWTALHLLIALALPVVFASANVLLGAAEGTPRKAGTSVVYIVNHSSLITHHIEHRHIVFGALTLPQWISMAGTCFFLQNETGWKKCHSQSITRFSNRTQNPGLGFSMSFANFGQTLNSFDTSKGSKDRHGKRTRINHPKFHTKMLESNRFLVLIHSSHHATNIKQHRKTFVSLVAWLFES